MESFQALSHHLASPPWLFALALVLFALSRGAKLPWTIAGGVGLATLVTALLGFGLGDPVFRSRVLHPERLPVVVLLLASGAVLWWEMYRIRQREEVRPTPPEAPPADLSTATFSTADVAAATSIGLLIVLGAAFMPAPLGGIADPSSQPELVKAPWLLAGLQELGQQVAPLWALVVLPFLFCLGLFALPYLEADDDSADPRLRGLFLFGWFFLWIGPLVVASLLRGPHWNAFGPFESWDATRPAMSVALPLSDRFWIEWLGIPQPARWWIRELPGLLFVAAYGLLLPRQLMRWRMTAERARTYREALGGWRFYAAVVWTLAILIVPLQLVSRWWLGIGDWINIPELGFRL
ncbi:MAG: hypothetical protein AAF657_15835 [Acidobacteriota bacterium]